MAANVIALPQVKIAPGPASSSPEQTYWKTFKSQILAPSPSSNPINHISFPGLPTSALTPPCDYFVATTGARVQIFSIRTRKLVKSIARFDDVAHSAEIRRDGRVLVAGDETGAIQAFDVGSRAILKTWKEHKQAVWTTKFSPVEPTALMSASDDSTVRLWDLPSSESVTTFVGHSDYVRSGTFLPGQASGLLVSGSYDQTVRLWDPRAPASAVMVFKHAAPIETVLPMPSGTTILSAAGSQISVLDIVASKAVHSIHNHQKTVTSLCLASNDSRLVSGGLDGHVKMFETTGWNVVAGSKYPSPVLSLSVVKYGTAQSDRHLVVGMQSGMLSIKTRLSGTHKVKEREREAEMKALLEGTLDAHDRQKSKQEKKKNLPSGWKTRLRGRDFTGEGADIVIEGNARDSSKKSKLRAWERLLRDAKYASALDLALDTNDPSQTLTCLVALRHRSALRTALADRDEMSLQPILRWVRKHVVDPRHVPVCVEVGTLLLYMYAGPMLGDRSRAVEDLMRSLHLQVRREVDRAQQAWQTHGMLGLVMQVD